MDIDRYNTSKSISQKPCPFNGAEEVFNEYYDTAGNYHWTGVITGEHIVRFNN